MGGNFRQPVTRRTLLKRMAALTAATWAQPLTGRFGVEAWAQTRGTAAFPQGTTLERTIRTRGGDGPYFALEYGPGWPIVVRDELAAPKPGREGRRVALASVVHYTDFQLVDAQSPARVEFLDFTADPPSPIPFGAAQRPQEMLVCHVVEAHVRKTRSISRGPITGRPADSVVCTGDNLDNTQRNEMHWFATLMDGGRFTANSGAADVIEGVQSFGALEYYDPAFYHPEPVDHPEAPDQYKNTYGYPDYPGLLEAILAPIDAVGLTVPWYSAYGNHDFLVQGNIERNELFEQIAVGNAKVLGPPAGVSPSRFVASLEQGDAEAFAALRLAPARPVAPDEDRHLMTPAEYIQAHLDSPASPGPVGHGFTEDNLDPLHLYYTFQVADGVLGITLDTTAPAGAEGTITDPQLQWLEQQLVAASSRYFDAEGDEVRTGNEDQLVVVFSHHRPASMQPFPIVTTKSGEPVQGHGGDEVIALLQRFPNVVLWVNGHSHFNRIVAHPHQDPRRSFWDLTTSAQIDPPQQARVLEVVDNRDDTLSIFTTVVDHAGPPRTSSDDYGLEGLAAIGRELAYNDFQVDVAAAIGEPTDLNTELVLVAPFDLSGQPASPPSPAYPPSPGAGSDGDADPAAVPTTPATGGGLAALAVGAALSGAIALRSSRREREDDDDRSGPASEPEG